MKNRTVIWKGFLMLLIGLSFCNTKGVAENEKPNKKSKKSPNIIYIIADDFSYKDLSIYGQKQYKTPNLDQLCKQGIRFSQAYSASGECAPSRSSVMTGLHTGHGRVRVNSSARGQDHLLDSDITVAEVLKSAGYATAFIGKWGIGQPQTEGVPYKQGFDYSFGYYDQVRAHTFFPDYLWENDKKITYPANAGFDMNKRYANNIPNPPKELLNSYDEQGKLILEEVADPQNAVFSEAVFEEKALNFIDKHSEEPFFLYYATQLPHGPVIIDSLGNMKDRVDIPQKQREWAAMVQRIDTFTGTLIETLKKKGIYENTVIVFSSDNGYSMAGYMGRGNAPKWEDDPWLKNKGPFTGGKFSIFEGGCRIPFFMTWEGHIQPSIVQKAVWLPDLFSTFSELANIKEVPKTDGNSLVPFFKNENTDIFNDRALYFSRQRAQAVRKGPWKAFRADSDAPLELYLVEEDTYNENNLAKDYPEVAIEMETIMNESHEPSEWYWNPWETRKDFEEKKKKAKELGQDLPTIRPNNIDRLPWEKKGDS
ncbi:arylsulfatase [Sediminitomix flava]|uniref:Arylsulfatase A-like enzyme n=1 Tax=Sediminitomix flava TaxID=379075 RepID=A0A315Z4F6_SEDFL|nr:arylsulfatase [Sediminitomix flava]PWJ37898.1 arylsulfatase A-like enzyme [Sediminitomix flava]